MRQNVTLAIERDLLRKARIRAAQEGSSVSGLLSRYLEAALARMDSYEAAQAAARELLDPGFHLGGKIPCAREEWHDRGEGVR
jgi:hypothetical protein